MNRRRFFASTLAAALLHVVKPLRISAPVPPVQESEYLPNPDYVSAEYECYFWVTDPQVPINFGRKPLL